MKTKNQWEVDWGLWGLKSWHVFNRKTSLTRKSFKTRQEAREYAKKLNKRSK